MEQSSGQSPTSNQQNSNLIKLQPIKCNSTESQAATSPFKSSNIKDSMPIRRISIQQPLNKSAMSPLQSLLNLTEVPIMQRHSILQTERKPARQEQSAQRQQQRANGDQEAFMEACEDLLAERLSKADPTMPKQQVKRGGSLSPLPNKQSGSSRNIPTYMKPSNTLSPTKRYVNSPLKQQETLLSHSQDQNLSFLVNVSPTQQQLNVQAHNQLIETPQSADDAVEPQQTYVDTHLEDTLIASMKKMTKLKKRLVEFQKDYRQYNFIHTSKRQSSRIIQSLGLNPMDKHPRKRPRISTDPNIVYIDLDCSDQAGGARDIVEIKVNRSPPLLLNTRQQPHYQLCYSNYTGLVNSLNERGPALMTRHPSQLNNASPQIAFQSSKLSNSHSKQQAIKLSQNEQKPTITVPAPQGKFPPQPSIEIQPDVQEPTFTKPLEDLFSQPDCTKSYLQTLEEFSQKLTLYDQSFPNQDAQITYNSIQQELITSQFEFDKHNPFDTKQTQNILVKLFYALPCRNYKDSLIRLVRIMPHSACLMHQLFSFCTYTLDKAIRTQEIKDQSFTERIENHLTFWLYRLEQENRILRNQVNATKDITISYTQLEQAYKELSDRYSKRIENSQEVADLIAKDIFQLNYHFRNSTSMQTESQDELTKKIEVIIQQFTIDSQQNTNKIGQLQEFLDKNITMLRNNWEDKRHAECQADLIQGASQQEEGQQPLDLWDVINTYNTNYRAERVTTGDQMADYLQFRHVSEQVVSKAVRSKSSEEFPKYQCALLDHFLSSVEPSENDKMKQATLQLAQYGKPSSLFKLHAAEQLQHLSLQGALPLVSTLCKYLFNFKSRLVDQKCKANSGYILKIQEIFEKLYISLGSILTSKKQFTNTFQVDELYENVDRQSQGFSQCQEFQGYDPTHLDLLFQKVSFYKIYFTANETNEFQVLSKDPLDASSKESPLALMQRLQFIQMLQNQTVVTKEEITGVQRVLGDHEKAFFLLVSQIETNVTSFLLTPLQNETVLDKRLWIMTLIKKLTKKKRKISYSYENLMGNFHDGEIGLKVRRQILTEFLHKKNPDKDFQESFYSNNGMYIFQDNLVDTKFNILSTQPVPVHTKNHSPGRSPLSRLWRGDTQKSKQALSRVVKRISIKRRLSIIRDVSEAIETVNENDFRLSFKRITKILNLCHILVPLVNVKANNSTDLSLEIRDLLEMSKSKEKYKRYIELQAQSLERMVEAFKIKATLNNFFLILNRYLIDRNLFYLNPLESASILTEAYQSHFELRGIYLRNSFFNMLKSERNGLIRAQLLQFMQEEAGITDEEKCEKVMYQLLMQKLKSKVDSPSVVNKALLNEQKVIYKYKDIEDLVVRQIAQHQAIEKVNNTHTLKELSALAKKVLEKKGSVKRFYKGIKVSKIK